MRTSSLQIWGGGFCVLKRHVCSGLFWPRGWALHRWQRAHSPGQGGHARGGGGSGGLLWVGGPGAQGSAPLWLGDGPDGTHAHGGVSRGVWAADAVTCGLRLGWKLLSQVGLRHKSGGPQSEARPTVGTQDGVMQGTEVHFSS